MHATGLVKPGDPDAKIKFLAAEALRGVGGLVFDALGNRFTNELGRHSVSLSTKRLLTKLRGIVQALHETRSHKILRVWCSICTGYGSVCLENGEINRKLIVRLPWKTAKDLDGGPYPAYPFGKSWDEGSGKPNYVARQ